MKLCGECSRALFKQPPPRDECPVCFLPLPVANYEEAYYSCCCKVICMGCIYAVETTTGEDERPRGSRICPFCRSPAATSDWEQLERLKKRVDADDADAINSLGCHYYYGRLGLLQDCDKANELWLRAVVLGHANAHFNVAVSYDNGEGVERDVEKARHYYALAAIRGNVVARHNLGTIETRAGNIHRAVKHYMIAAGAGYDNSLMVIRESFLNGYVSRRDFEKALRSHKEATNEMKSDQRDAATVAMRAQAAYVER